MSEKIYITLPYPPSANKIYRRGPRGQVMTTVDVRAYKKEVWVLCRQAKVKPFATKYFLNFTMRVYRPQLAGDLDNRIKVALDALNGNAFWDDRQIVEIHAFRFDDADNPRIEVEIEQSRFIG